MNLALYAGIGLLVAAFVYVAKQIREKPRKGHAPASEGDAEKGDKHHAKDPGAHHKVLHSISHWMHEQGGQLFKLLTLCALLFILYHIAWKSDVIRPELEARLYSGFLQGYKVEIILAALLLFGWIAYSLRGGGHAGGSGAHLIEHGKIFLGRTFKLLMCALVFVGIISCATETWHFNTLRVGYQQSLADKAANARPSEINMVVLKTNYVINPGQSITTPIIPGHMKSRLYSDSLQNFDVLTEHIFFNRVPTTNGVVIVPIMTNMVMFWSTNRYSRDSEHIVRITSVVPRPLLVELTMGL